MLITVTIFRKKCEKTKRSYTSGRKEYHVLRL